MSHFGAFRRRHVQLGFGRMAPFLDVGPVENLVTFSDLIQSQLLHNASSLRAHFAPDHLHHVRYEEISSDLPGFFWSWIGATSPPAATTQNPLIRYELARLMQSIGPDL